MAVVPAVPERRRSSRLRNTLESSGFQQRLAVKGGVEQCCACLLDVDAADEDGEFMAVLDCCQPLHHFHVSCIFMWAEQENSCPQCKRRFSRLGVYGLSGNLLRVARVETRDQDFAAEAGSEAEDAEEVVCQACGKSGDEEKLLLCDGRGGRCNAAYHCYCVGLSDVPEGDWFCPSCAESRGQLSALSRQGSAASSLGASPSSPPASAASPTDALVASQPSADEGQSAAAAGDASCAKTAQAPRLWASVKREVGVLTLDLDEDDDASESTGALGGAKRQLPTVVKDEQDTQAELDSLRSARLDRKPSTSAHPAPKRSTSRTSLAASPRASATTKRPKPEVKEEKPRVQSGGSQASAPSKGAQPVAPAGPEAFGGLCCEMPKWISRQGRLVRVDLGGRGVRDAAAMVLARVVRGALGQVASSKIAVSLNLAGNQLRKQGLQALLEAVSGAGVRVEKLDLERNLLDASAAECLARWCEEQATGPPQELYLSHNRIGDAGACNVLIAMGRSTAPKVDARSPARRAIPLWVEAREAGILHAESILTALSRRVPVCLALDRSACGPARCGSCQGAAGQSEVPRLHLFGIMDQTPDDVQDGEDEEEAEAPCKQEAAKAEAQRGARVKLEPPSSPGRRRAASEANASQAAPAQQPQPEVAGGGDSSSSSDSESNAAPSPAASRGRGQPGRRGRGRGRGRASADAPEPVVEVPAELLEAEKRRSWAQTLGAHGGAARPVDFAGDAPASTGLWDLAFAKDQQKRQLAAAKKRQRSAPGPAAAAKPPAEAKPPPPRSAEGPARSQVRMVNGCIVRGPPTPAELAEAVELELVEEAEDALALALRKVPGEVEEADAGAAGAASAPGALGAEVGGWVPLAWAPETVVAPLVGAGASGYRGAGPQDGHLAKQPDCDGLRELVMARLQRERRLWYGEDEYERRVRRRCLRDQLCRKAQEKYAQVVSTHSAWEDYLRSSAGFRRTVSWVDRKIQEVVANEAAKRRRR